MCPYSSITANIAVLGLTPEKLSATVPETVTGTSLPLGGQSDDGLATTLTTGGVRSILTAAVASALMLPALSRARSPMRLEPSPLIWVEVLPPAATVTCPLLIQ